MALTHVDVILQKMTGFEIYQVSGQVALWGFLTHLLPGNSQTIYAHGNHMEA